MAKAAYQNGLYTIPDTPYIFQCKADCYTLSVRIAGLVGSSHPFTRGHGAGGRILHPGLCRSRRDQGNPPTFSALTPPLFSRPVPLPQSNG